MNAPTLLLPADFPDYALLDSGAGRRLERLGEVITDRPEPQALWPKALPEHEWAKAHAVFSGGDDDGEQEGGKSRWQIRPGTPDTWPVCYPSRHGPIRFFGRLTAFRHLGCFPDQAPHWAYLAATLQPGDSVLNLFGYSGAASLVAAAAGAEVVHVDASKKAIGYARENAELAGLESKPIRWLCDDALAFCQREVRRGRRYRGIILDPPKFGRGPDSEVWDFFADMPELLHLLPQLSNPGGDAFTLLTAYALRASSEALASALAAAYSSGSTHHGSLVLADGAGRRFATALWAHWQGSATS